LGGIGKCVPLIANTDQSSLTIDSRMSWLAVDRCGVCPVFQLSLLVFDDARVDAVAARFQDSGGDFREQLLAPAAQAGRAARLPAGGSAGSAVCS
jgi:hypothetical protein